jgi:hypothetical protein
MEQELRFGLDLGRLALLKKNIWADYEQLLRPFFSSFRGQKKKIKNIVASALNIAKNEAKKVFFLKKKKKKKELLFYRISNIFNCVLLQ